MELEIVEYPALVYKGNRNNLYMANCLMKNIIGYGGSISEAVKNLESALNDCVEEYIVKVKPMYGLQLNQV